jgi:beta-glucosidase
LFGDVSPGGKLRFTCPRTVGQVPMVYSHTMSHDPDNQGRRYWHEDGTPLFPFGHSLSYRRFEHDSNLRLDQPVIGIDATVGVSVVVTNSGGCEADEVVQL